MQTVEITSGVVVDSAPRRVGDVLTVSDRVARYLVTRGKARAVASESTPTTPTTTNPSNPTGDAEAPPKRRRGRPRKVNHE